MNAQGNTNTGVQNNPTLAPRNARAAQSMYQSPTTTTAHHQPLRRIASSPPVYHNAPVYGPDPNLMFRAPQPAPIFAQPTPYVPPYAANHMSMYYPPPMIQSPIPPPSYGYSNDQTFEAYFGPDVRPSPRSPIELQREQLENFGRNRPQYSQSNNQSNTRSSMITSAEDRALEEAIQLSLAESKQRQSRGPSVEYVDYTSGVTTRTDSGRSARDVLEGVRNEWEEVNATGLSAEELADEKALQEAIIASIILESEKQHQQQQSLPYSAAAVTATTTPRARELEGAVSRLRLDQPMPMPPVPADRQYPYNLPEEVRRSTLPQKASFTEGESFYQEYYRSPGALLRKQSFLEHGMRSEPTSTDESSDIYADREHFASRGGSRPHREASPTLDYSSTGTGTDLSDASRSPAPVYPRHGQEARRTSSGRDFHESHHHHHHTAEHHAAKASSPQDGLTRHQDQLGHHKHHEHRHEHDRVVATLEPTGPYATPAQLLKEQPVAVVGRRPVVEQAHLEALYPTKFAPSRQSSHASGSHYNSSHTASEDEDENHEAQQNAHPPIPTFNHATLRAPTPPTLHPINAHHI